METVLRVFLIYLAIMIGLRLMGKREFSQLAPLDLVSILLIPEIVSQALVREDYSITNALIGVTTLLMLVYFTSIATQKSKLLGNIISGSPTILVQEGKLLVSNMNRERITPDELMGELHRSGLYDLSQVKWAILESDGKISIIPKSEDSTGVEKRRPKSEIKAS